MKLAAAPGTCRCVFLCVCLDCWALACDGICWVTCLQAALPYCFTASMLQYIQFSDLPVSYQLLAALYLLHPEAKSSRILETIPADVHKHSGFECWLRLYHKSYNRLTIKCWFAVRPVSSASNNLFVLLLCSLLTSCLGSSSLSNAARHAARQLCTHFMHTSMWLACMLSKITSNHSGEDLCWVLECSLCQPCLHSP